MQIQLSHRSSTIDPNKCYDNFSVTEVHFCLDNLKMIHVAKNASNKLNGIAKDNIPKGNTPKLPH